MAAVERNPMLTTQTVRQLVVPIDGSADSWRGFDVAVGLARRLDIGIRLVQVVYDPLETNWARATLDTELIRRRPPIEVNISISVRSAPASVASEIEHVVDEQPNSVVVMASHGRGRSAAIVGSVARDMLQRAFGPILLVGPAATSDDLNGPITVTVDGSSVSESALAVAAAWAQALHRRLWIIHVVDPATSTSSEVPAGGYPARLADELRAASNVDVEFDVLHHVRPGRAVVDDAARRNTSLIVATARGGAALSHVVMGSVTAEFVRRARCPVLVVPPRR
jgi:nucleotide-binding universal stress UspA family protein